MKKPTDKKTILYIAMAVLLLLCLLDMPYGFYTFIRFVATIAFCYFAYDAYKLGNKQRAIVFVILAVMFQPLFMLHLGRVMWNIVDVAVAGYLVYLILKTSKSKDGYNDSFDY